MAENMKLTQKKFEDAIKAYNGPDPLAKWYEFICWMDILPNSSGTVRKILSKCITKLSIDPRYKQDPRMLRIIIKYSDSHLNPPKVLETFYQKGIGTFWADFYIAWAFYLDIAHKFKDVEKIFQNGFQEFAQPYGKLVKAHQEFRVSMSHRLLYEDGETKKKFKDQMEVKKKWLTSLNLVEMESAQVFVSQAETTTTCKNLFTQNTLRDLGMTDDTMLKVVQSGNNLSFTIYLDESMDLGLGGNAGADNMDISESRPSSQQTLGPLRCVTFADTVEKIKPRDKNDN